MSLRGILALWNATSLDIPASALPVSTLITLVWQWRKGHEGIFARDFYSWDSSIGADGRITLDVHTRTTTGSISWKA